MRFYVSRSGWNTANQPSSCSPHTVRVAEVEAADGREACQLAAQRVEVYNGQYLSSESAEEADAKEAAVDSAVTVLA